nr:MAG TPA: neurotoxin [Caudoviricetes sp.]
MTKYQEGLEKTKDFLRKTPEPQMRELCDQAGLTDKETEMIVQKFRKGKTRLHTSYDLGMSESRYSIKMTLILNIMKKVLVQWASLTKHF